MIGFFINVFILLSIFVIFQGKRNKRTLLVLSLGYLALLTMLRSESVGTDTRTYSIIFQKIANMNRTEFISYITKTNNEIGFVYFCRLLSYITHNPQILYIVSGFISYLSLYTFFKEYSIIPWASVFLFFTIGGFDFYLSGIRQGLSIAFILLAYQLWKKKKSLLTIILFILAVLFHYSSIAIVFVVLCISKINDKKYNFLVILFTLIIIILFNPILNIILKILPKYRYYENSVLFLSETKLAVVLKIVVFFLVYCTGKYVGKNSIKTLQFNLDFEKITLLVPLIYCISWKARALARFGVTLMPFVYVYFPNAISTKDEFNRKSVYFLMIICFLVYAYLIQVLKTPEWQQTYPYSFFWE